MYITRVSLWNLFSISLSDHDLLITQWAGYLLLETGQLEWIWINIIPALSMTVQQWLWAVGPPASYVNQLGLPRSMNRSGFPSEQ